jgi:transketolase
MADAENGEPRVILIGTGSEVQLCIAAYEELRREGVAARVVSMPSWELFERQDGGYREAVLPNQDLEDIHAYLSSVPKPTDYKTIPLLAE